MRCDAVRCRHGDRPRASRIVGPARLVAPAAGPVVRGRATGQGDATSSSVDTTRATPGTTPRSMAPTPHPMMRRSSCTTTIRTTRTRCSCEPVRKHISCSRRTRKSSASICPIPANAGSNTRPSQSGTCSSARLPGLENAATIITSRRRYELDLRSSDDGKVFHRVSWHYLEGEVQSAAGDVSPFGIEYPKNVPESNAAGSSVSAAHDGQAIPGMARPDGPHIALDHANFDYRVEGHAPFAPVIVFDDGRFTYLQLPHEAELPAILLMDDKGEAEIASFIPLGNDFYEVQQTIPYGLLLKRGKEEVRIFNGQGKGCGLFGCDSARMKNVYGKP
ncbi:TrbG/VirB9 family P-type conjugative transfer protein [Burkholderia pseudomallei]|uniref:TrbG/VirB9 family P-type conjugative transfer protein n=1 Tax=Burkholderia pseudomallei TaxID=28450 RepID=UPI0031406B23